MAVGQTQYPGAADTAQTLVEPSDWPVVTELRRRIDASETTLPVQTTARLSPSGVVEVEGERVSYTGLTATTLTGCVRGAFQSDGGTAAVGHRGGAKVVEFDGHL